MSSWQQSRSQPQWSLWKRRQFEHHIQSPPDGLTREASHTQWVPASLLLLLSALLACPTVVVVKLQMAIKQNYLTINSLHKCLATMKDGTAVATTQFWQPELLIIDHENTTTGIFKDISDLGPFVKPYAIKTSVSYLILTYIMITVLIYWFSPATFF